MSHTKGPWEVRFTNHGYTVWAPVGKTGSMQIAILGHSETFDKANARLVAAGPILFDFVLKKAQEGDLDAKKIISNI